MGRRMARDQSYRFRRTCSGYHARCFDICKKAQTSNERFTNAAEAKVGEVSDLKQIYFKLA
jgi:hypothetical protein